jgi:glutamate transport system permease protein
VTTPPAAAGPRLSDYSDLLIEGFLRTLQVTALAFLLALVVGTVVATMRVSPLPPLRIAGAVYVETLRNVPLLGILLFIVFGFPKLGMTLDFVPSAVIGCGLYTGAFVAEVIRSGINAVGVGQAEAARSIGLTFGGSLRHIILPQALRTVVGPMATVFIALTKNTSLASAISVTELTATLNQVIEGTSQALAALLIVSALYMAVTIPAGLLAGVVERRYAVHR